MPVPTYDKLFQPLLDAIHSLGGSASVAEQEDRVAELLKLSEEAISEVHRGNRTKLSYRLAWARNYLKRFGILENSNRGIWSLTPIGQATKSVELEHVKKFVQSLDRPADKTHAPVTSPVWQYRRWILKKYRGKMIFWKTPKDDSHRTRLKGSAERLLRESGFIQVDVTGKSGMEELTVGVSCGLVDYSRFTSFSNASAIKVASHLQRSEIFEERW